MPGFFLLLALSDCLAAEVFKCTDKIGKTLYQSKPCANAAQGKQLQINGPTAAEEAQAKAKFQALEAEYDANRTKRQAAEKQELEQRNQAAVIEAIKQSALAQKQLVDIEQKRAEMQTQFGNTPLLILPYSANNHAHGSGHQPPQQPAEIEQLNPLEMKQESIVQKRLADPVFENAIRQKQETNFSW
jgi:hypothetical protein